MKLKLTEIKKLAEKAIEKYGYTKEETSVIQEVLLYAQMRGNNQGVVKLIGKGIPKPKDAGKIEIEKNTKLSLLINANKNNGMVAVNYGTDMAIQKAKEHGIEYRLIISVGSHQFRRSGENETD